MRQLLKITATFALALVFSAGMAFGQSNTSTIDQTGEDHSADVIQNGGNNTVDLEQADTDLTDGVDNSMEADVRQKFDGNEAYIDQEGSEGGANKGIASAEVDQVGNNNYLDLEQGPFFRGHSADIDQLGNNNTVRLRSSNGGGEANVYFDGNRNKLVRSNSSGQLLSGEQVVQKNGSGRSQFIDVTVNGDGNKIGADQQNGDGRDQLTVDITGNQNFVPTYQGAKNGDIDITVDNGYDNFLKAVQNGNNSTATIDLNGMSDDNQAVINQSSAGNTATITVDGMSNTATVQQQ